MLSNRLLLESSLNVKNFISYANRRNFMCLCKVAANHAAMLGMGMVNRSVTQKLLVGGMDDFDFLLENLEEDGDMAASSIQKF